MDRPSTEGAELATPSARAGGRRRRSGAGYTDLGGRGRPRLRRHSRSCACPVEPASARTVSSGGRPLPIVGAGDTARPGDVVGRLHLGRGFDQAVDPAGRSPEHPWPGDLRHVQRPRRGGRRRRSGRRHCPSLTRTSTGLSRTISGGGEIRRRRPSPPARPRPRGRPRHRRAPRMRSLSDAIGRSAGTYSRVSARTLVHSASRAACGSSVSTPARRARLPCARHGGSPEWRGPRRGLGETADHVRHR